MPFLFALIFLCSPAYSATGVIFIFAVYFSRKKQRMLCCIGAVALVLGGFLLLKGEFTDSSAVSNLFSHDLNLKNADTNAARVEFLTGLGWKVSDEPVEVRDVVIPLEFDQVYQNYNLIQLDQGFDLTQYAGRRMKCYTYDVLNYPNGEENIRVNLLVYKERLVGGDVCSLRLDGFMHGLQLPQQQTDPA